MNESPKWYRFPSHLGQSKYAQILETLVRHYPKDDFPLPNIDILVDLTVGHEMLSLMDGFSSYNQIQIAEKD